MWESVIMLIEPDDRAKQHENDSNWKGAIFQVIYTVPGVKDGDDIVTQQNSFRVKNDWPIWIQANIEMSCAEALQTVLATLDIWDIQ